MFNLTYTIEFTYKILFIIMTRNLHRDILIFK